jgi:putative membrane protein
VIDEPSWRLGGSEPDYRFSLANERTFLAWIRTALAVLAGGMLLDQFATKLQRHIVVGLALALCFMAAGLAVLAYAHWRDNEIAMRHQRKLPWSRALIALSAGVCGTACALAILLLVAGR